MIQANVAAAETLEAKRQTAGLPHPRRAVAARSRNRCASSSTPSASRWRAAPNCAPSQFNRILDRVRDGEHEALVNEVVLRTQSQAVYSPDNLGHFGLNLRRYAHFTSPIRRYADLIVHRALISALVARQGRADGQQEEARLEDISGLISATERRAMAAERDTVDRLIAAHLAERINGEFDGRVSGVTKAGLFVQLPQFGTDGFVPVATLDDDYYVFDETARALVGERTGKGYPACRPRDGQARRCRAACRRAALRDAERTEAPAGRQTVVPQGKKPRQKQRACLATSRSRSARAGDDDGRTGVRRRQSHRQGRSAAVDRDEARLSRPLPALRRRTTVPFVPEDRRPLRALRRGNAPSPRRRSAGLSGGRHRRPHRRRRLHGRRGDQHAVDLAASGDLGTADDRPRRWRCCGRSRALSSACNGRSICMASAAKTDRIEPHPEA